MNQITDNSLLGRVVSQNRLIYHVLINGEEKVGRVSGKLQYELLSKQDYPVVGDWVMCKENGEDVVIQSVLPRKSIICRKVAGAKSEQQVLAANIDKVFIAMALNNDFNLRRLERYLAIAWDSGAIPIALLTKADLCEEREMKEACVRECALGVEVISISTVTDEGVETLRECIGKEDTVVFIGSSGVGKSSIVNRLMGETIQVVKDIDEHDKGRHTTTHRELFVLPTGGMIIDTPGMRELQFNQGDMETTFKDIESISAGCYFNDCKHEKEPGCAIRKAIETGELSEERYRSYVKLKKELQIQEARRKHKEKINLRKNTPKRKEEANRYERFY